MKCKTIQETKKAMEESGENWRIPFMEFVDDFRRTRDYSLIEKPFEPGDEKPGDGKPGDEKFASLLASTIEYLCDEMGLESPDWSWDVPSCREPWFVSGSENVKAISIVESPAFFRRRKIFVLENFLSRA